MADWTSLAVYFIEWGEMIDNVSDINTPEIGLSGLFKTRLGQILRYFFSSKTHNAVHINQILTSKIGGNSNNVRNLF